MTGWKDTKGDWSQRNQRREQMFRDQHGREYHGTIELKTGDPCGVLQPMYSAPLPVPLMYLRKSPDPMRPYDMIVDYPRWEADITAANDDWEREGRSRSRKIHGSAYDATKPFSAEVLEIIGERPQQIDPVIAARQGNRWVLGLSKVIDERLVKFFEPEQIDPNWRRKHEPDYTDAVDAELDDGLERRLTLEQQYDPNADGGKRHGVRGRTGKFTKGQEAEPA